MERIRKVVDWNAEGLRGKRVLVAEDEAIIALDVELMLEDADVEVIGPHASLSSLMDAIDGVTPDAALLDVRLGRDEVYPAARELSRRGVPMIFHSGHCDRSTLLALFPNAQACPKPCSGPQLLRALAGMVH